jgi:membrane protein
VNPVRRTDGARSVERLRGSARTTGEKFLSWRAGSLALRTMHRFLSINGTERSLVIAAQAFSALIPLLIVVSTLVSSSGGPRIANTLVTRFRLGGNAADAVRQLFAQPPGAAQSITAGSALLLVLSGLGLARTVQRTYESAWQFSPRGLRGAFGGLAALALLLTQILLLSLLVSFLRSVPATSVVTPVVRAMLSSLLWLALQYLFLGGRVRWRRLLPGAVAAGVGQQLVAEVSTLWIPHVVEQNASRYGAIGVSFALLSWLVLIAFVLVVAAALSAELGGCPPPPLPAHASRSAALHTLAGLLGADDASSPVPGKSSPERFRTKTEGTGSAGAGSAAEAPAVSDVDNPNGRHL